MSRFGRLELAYPLLGFDRINRLPAQVPFVFPILFYRRGPLLFGGKRLFLSSFHPGDYSARYGSFRSFECSPFFNGAFEA